MSNLFDKTKKAVVTTATVTSAKPVETVHKTNNPSVWITVKRNADGDAVIICRNDKDGTERQWSTVDATEAELLLSQLVNDYLLDGKVLR